MCYGYWRFQGASRLHTLQDSEGERNRPLWSWSRFINDTRRIYVAAHREWYAVVWAALLPDSNLDRTELTISIYYESLKWILNLSDTTGMLRRTRIYLSKLDLDIILSAGTRNQSAAVLSKRETGRKHCTVIRDYLLVATIDFGEDKYVALEAPPYTVCHLWDHEEEKPGTKMIEI